MIRVFVARVLVGLVVIACACRRKHEDPGYVSDTPATSAAATSAPAAADLAQPSGDNANPLHEPVLARGDDRARLPDGGTLNGDPRGPRPAEWKAIVDGALPLLQACFDRANLPPGEIPVAMHYTVEPPGYTGAVRADGNAPRAALDCCVGVIEALKFPQYRGPKVERDLAFTWTRQDPKARAASADGGAGATTRK